MPPRRPATTKTKRAHTGSRRALRLKVDPTRLALAAMERIKTVLTRLGHPERFGRPVAPRELLAREDLLLVPLPASYAAAMKVADAIGDAPRLLNFLEMKQAEELVDKQGAGRRFLPFAARDEAYVCFDRSARDASGELAIAEWTSGLVRDVAAHFAEWLDVVADEREEAIDRAASLPPELKKLLVQLGFSFDDPIVGRLETADQDAIVDLIGDETAGLVRGDVDRLFDSSGRASLVLNLDEFSLAVSLRTGIFVFEAEEVFRWLRSFRDENFFGDAPKNPSHPDKVRDLRKASREAPLVLRGVTEIPGLPARKHTFRAASGRSADDYYLLGRTSSTSERSPSLLLHVVKGRVLEAHEIDEPLMDLYVTTDGTVWGLSHTGNAVRFAGGMARAFPLVRSGGANLQRQSRGRAWWYGIGGGGDRVLVWGAGTLVEFDGERLVPFEPNAGLQADESVVALWASRREIAMLVCGDLMGAVARYDGARWLPINDNQVIEAQLVDLDIWHDVALVLARDGRVWRIEGDAAPRLVPWNRQHDAFLHEGVPRPTYAIRGFDGGGMLASDGGAIVVGQGEPVFFRAAGTREQARIVRIGGRQRTSSSAPSDGALVALVGPHVWLWTNGGFQPVDLKEW